MKLCVRKTGRPNRLDLVRRAKALGVTHGHLSRVISGKRESATLLARFRKLLESESSIKKPSTK